MPVFDGNCVVWYRQVRSFELDFVIHYSRRFSNYIKYPDLALLRFTVRLPCNILILNSTSLKTVKIGDPMHVSEKKFKKHTLLC